MFTIPLHCHSTSPLYQQIYEYIKTEIQNGNLPFCTKLPSTRGLASHLQISRNTVETAYQQLLSEGYLEVYPKRGYYVNEISVLSQLSAKPFKTLSTSKTTEIYPYNFSPFSVDIDHFPFRTWQQLSKNSIMDRKDLFLLGDNQGDDSLRNAISNYLHQSRGVNGTKDHIIIGAGVDYLLQLLSYLLPSHSSIALEDPTYKRAYQIFNGLGFQTVPIPLDKHGIDLHKLENSRANIAYVTPSHQYPLGIVMPIKRRQELLDWASKKENHYIIEDDHDSEFRFKGKPIPALQGIDMNDKVIYIGTFSKAIAPAIRVGYMVLPTSLLKQYKKYYNYYSSTVSRIDQDILTNFIEMGYFERHLNRMRKLYKLKHDTLLSSLKIFQDQVTIQGENAGLHLVLQIHSSISENNVISLASTHGIKLYGLSEHYIKPPVQSKPTLLMGYANLTEADITNGVFLLYQILKENGYVFP